MEWLGEWQNKTLADLIDFAVETYPDKEAMVIGDERVSYGELGHRVDALAKGLIRMGIQQQDKVAIWLSNRLEWPLFQFAIAKIGAISVPLSTRFKAFDLEYILDQSDACALVMMDHFINIDYMRIIDGVFPERKNCAPGALEAKKLPKLKHVICVSEKSHAGLYGFKDLLKDEDDAAVEAEFNRRRAAIDPDHIINLPYTSGTTGFPKGVLTSHRQYIGETFVFKTRLQINDGDRFLAPAPFFANFGNYFGMLLPMMVGGCSIPLDVFDAEDCLKLIEREKCTHFTGTPTMYLDILNHPRLTEFDLGSLRTGMTGAGPASVQMINDVREKMGIRILCNGYGMTENSGATTMTSFSDSPELMATTTGPAFPDVKIKIVSTVTGKEMPTGEIGEICVKGWIVMKGYYKMPEETVRCFDADGWFHTGDLGFLDKDGNFSITGRLKDMFISGGTNVYPTEVENFLYTFPKIKQVAVIGVPDERMGEVGFAFVVLKTGEKTTREEIRQYCKANIANYKIPKYYQFVDEIPMTGVGKIQKFKLEEAAKREINPS